MGSAAFMGRAAMQGEVTNLMASVAFMGRAITQGEAIIRTESEVHMELEPMLGEGGNRME